MIPDDDLFTLGNKNHSFLFLLLRIVVQLKIHAPESRYLTFLGIS